MTMRREDITEEAEHWARTRAARMTGASADPNEPADRLGTIEHLAGLACVVLLLLGLLLLLSAALTGDAAFAEAARTLLLIGVAGVVLLVLRSDR